MRWLAKLYAGGTPDKSKGEYWTDGTIPWLNSGAVNQGLIAVQPFSLLLLRLQMHRVVHQEARASRGSQ